MAQYAKPSVSAAEDQSALLAKQRAQARRAQVRRAQIQHRKRKADYARQLETEIADYRNMIADLNVECDLLRKENEAARALLAATSTLPVQRQWQQQQQEHHHQGTQHPGHGDPELVGATNFQPDSYSSNADIDDWMVSLVKDEAMETRAWQVSYAPSRNHSTALSTKRRPRRLVGEEQVSAHNDDDIASVPGLGHLSPAQTQQAINFILAMEHCCKDHFRAGDLGPDLRPAIELRPSSGHQMMATTLTLREAPPAIFAGMWPSLPGGHETRVSKLPAESSSWRASGLTLAALHGLAQSLAPLAGPELTPVQAWFELAERFPAELLLRADISDGLKSQFVGVVKCLNFGAVVERDAFESVVSRVLAAEMGGDGSSIYSLSQRQEPRGFHWGTTRSSN